MTRTLLLAMAVLGVATAVAIGSYTALAGSSPVGDVAGAVIGHDGEDGEAVAEDAAEGDEASVQADGETGEGAEHIAGLIADAFGAEEAEVLALHEEEGIGFGALFKLYALAAATGTSVDDLLAAIATDAEGEFEFAFGKRFNDLTEEQLAALEEGPKNLGQLVSASNHPDEDGEADADAASQALEKAQAKFAAKSSEGNGPPDGVPAHGRN
ncbi:MAG: hypothetical protein Q7R32_03845 [Dehalococcoidia bacterium]|nr:hypothetical protein [Dehalococcoidia bacterium]